MIVLILSGSPRKGGNTDLLVEVPELFDSILSQYRLCLNFFKLEDAGRVLVRGAKDKGDIWNTDALHEAFHLGSNVQ